MAVTIIPCRRWTYIFAGMCLLAAFYLLTFPLQDYDTFWHLAYGRAMAQSGTFINHEIFSYTAQGKYLGSHSQLAQVILYALWAVGGANALLVFKLAVAGVVFGLLVKTARLCGLDFATAAMLALVVLAVGMSRLVERPELFSVLLQALLLWVLFRAKSLGYPARWLWFIPPIMVVWDYLHGALYGLIILCVFASVEFIKQVILPKFGICVFAGNIPRAGINRLGGWFLVTLIFMSIHPNGLLNYSHFWRVGSAGHEYRMYGEWMTPDFAQFAPYWVLLTVVLAAVALSIRSIDMTALVVMLPFLYLSITYNRAVLAFGLAAVPVTAQALNGLSKVFPSERTRMILMALLGTTILCGVFFYKQFGVIDSHRFGLGLNDSVFPVGSTRFVVDNELSGNMYNMDAFGGYLAFTVGPARKIFNYNQPGVFTALFDYLHKPATRAQWHINYAIIGNPAEIGAFQQDGFVPVYWEPGSAVFVRANENNSRIIEKYRIDFFNPFLSDQKLLSLGMNPRSSKKMLQELASYLTYREDSRVAGLFARLLRDAPGVADDRQRLESLVPTLKYNEFSTDLLLLQGEIIYRQGDLGGAASLFSQVIKRDFDNFQARIGLGYVNYDQRQFHQAAEQFTILTDRYPSSAEAHYALGLAAFRLCQWQKAKKAFETFLEMAPGDRYAVKAKEFLSKIGSQVCEL